MGAWGLSKDRKGRAEAEIRPPKLCTRNHTAVPPLWDIRVVWPRTHALGVSIPRWQVALWGREWYRQRKALHKMALATD